MKPRLFLFSPATEESADAGVQQGAAAAESVSDSVSESVAASEPAAGDAPAGDEAPEEVPAESATQSGQPEGREPTLLERAFAAAKGKATLLAENHDLQARLATAEEELSSATDELQGAHGEILDLKSRIASLESERDAVTAALTTTEEAAAHQVAALGIQPDDLPETVKPGDTVEELQAALDAATDNADRYELSQRIARLQGWAVAPAAN